MGLDYHVSLHLAQVRLFLILIYFSIVIWNFNCFQYLPGWLAKKKITISTQKCSLFLSIILVRPLVKICFYFPFLSIKTILLLFNHIIIYTLELRCFSNLSINQCLQRVCYNNIYVYSVYVIIIQIIVFIRSPQVSGPLSSFYLCCFYILLSNLLFLYKHYGL